VHPGRLERPACGFEVFAPSNLVCSGMFYNVLWMYILQGKTGGF